MKMESQNETKTENNRHSFQKLKDKDNEFSLLYGGSSGTGKTSNYRARFVKLQPMGEFGLPRVLVQPAS